MGSLKDTVEIAYQVEKGGDVSKLQCVWKMNSRKLNTLLIIFVISVAILSHVGVEATRVLAEDFAKANHLETYSSVYEKAKFTMSCWLERLASGPSPRGPGH
ncbi:hypothetical protein Goshw_007271 [Gossypium schwendimanii]|uniref:Uncharacterized protein n=2 Tax=Gossypium TaxID=3633 RepID=A0A7J9MGH6_GOSSC|nr:hypothetical protein [Gossypium schwendimanii]